MNEKPGVTLRLWTRRARRFVRWVGRRDRHDRMAMWHLDRLALALAQRGWRTRRQFHTSPPTLRVGATNHVPAIEELTATHFGRWVYLARSSALPLPCTDLPQAVTDVERIIFRRLDKASPMKEPHRERQR